MSLLLTLNRVHTMFCCFHWWLWRRKCRLGIKVPKNRHLTSLLSLRCLLWPHCSSLYFKGHFVAPRPTLVHYWGDSLTRPMLITAFLLFRSVGHREPRNLDCSKLTENWKKKTTTTTKKNKTWWRYIICQNAVIGFFFCRIWILV